MERFGEGNNQERKPENLISTIKLGGGGVMIWLLIAAAGVNNLIFIDCIMSRFEYLKVLQSNLQSLVNKSGLRSNSAIKQDN